MNILDDAKRAKRLDPNGALDSVAMLGQQFSQVFNEFAEVKIPSSFKNIKKIVHSGMGGSALGAHIIQSVYFSNLKVPFEVVNGYQAPANIDQDTLYIICSYSGTTEEPLASYAAAKKAGAKIFGITSGGTLGQMINQGKLAGYIFNPLANPSGQPRIGVGYTIAAELALLKKLGLINLPDGQIKTTLLNLQKANKKFGFGTMAVKNPAKQLAQKMKNHEAVIVASEHLSGNAHVFANQTNETGKTLATYHLIPELNHYLLEGLKFPSTNKKSLLFIFLESNLYHKKIQSRYKITKEVVSKNKVKHASCQLLGKDRLSQAIEAIAFSGYVTFYLAIINNVNPNKIPYVDYFKKQLNKIK